MRRPDFTNPVDGMYSAHDVDRDEGYNQRLEYIMTLLERIVELMEKQSEKPQYSSIGLVAYGAGGGAGGTGQKTITIGGNGNPSGQPGF